MINKIIHVSGFVPEKLYKNLKKIVGLKGTTLKDCMYELIAVYVDANKDLLDTEKQKVA